MDFVAGVLLFGTELKEEDQNLLERIKKPLVLYDCELPDSRYSSVCADNRQMLKVLWIICTRKGYQIFIISAQGKIIIIIEFVKKHFKYKV